MDKYSPNSKSEQYSSHGATGVGTTSHKATDFWRHSQPVHDGHPAQRYLESRGLWPLLPGEELRCGRRYDAASGVDSFFLVAELSDHEGYLRAIQYLRLDDDGEALIGDDGHKDRVTIGPAKGCAVWPFKVGVPRVGVAEGLETAMAVRRLYDIPCFATLGAWGLKAFRPPAFVRELLIFGDHDKPGMEAAAYLRDRLALVQELGRQVPSVNIWRPDTEGWDFADVWEARL